MSKEQWRLPRAAGLAASVVLGLSALAVGGATAAPPEGVTLSNAWGRMIVPSRPAAGYFKLTNDGDAAATLTGVSSPACGSAMLHQSIRSNGEDKMVPVTQVDVPAHGVLEFAPGGYHVMCMQPSADMKIGAEVPFTLTFADGADITAPFPVKGPTGK